MNRMNKDKKLSGNRKGQVQYFLENAFRVGFLMIALLVFFLLINFYINNKIDTNRLQAEVTANRIIYSNTIMYEENQRVYIGIIDVKKFNDVTIDEKINYPIKRHATAKLELINNTDGLVAHTTYLGKEQYENLEVIAKVDGEGKGGATKYLKKYPVTYLEGNTYRFGTLKITIIIPNS
jgi:hypothetical protein